MSTSELEAVIRTQNSEHGADDPADTLRARLIANNIAHLSDQSAQVIANWSCADGSGISRAIGTGPFFLWESHPYPARFRPDGSSYRLRVRARALVTGGTAKLYVALQGLAPLRRSGLYSITSSIESGSLLSPVESFAVSSGTGAWLTPDGDQLIHQPDASESIVATSTLDALSGDPVTIEPAMMSIVVYGYITTSTPTVELTGLYAAEYVGT